MVSFTGKRMKTHPYPVKIKKKKSRTVVTLRRATFEPLFAVSGQATLVTVTIRYIDILGQHACTWCTGHSVLGIVALSPIVLARAAAIL